MSDVGGWILHYGLDFCLCCAIEYTNVPKTAIIAPIIPTLSTGVLKTITETKMMTTLLMALVTASVEGIVIVNRVRSGWEDYQNYLRDMG